MNILQQINYSQHFFVPQIQTIMYFMMYEPGNYITPTLDVGGQFGGGEWHASPQKQDDADGLKPWNVGGVDVVIFEGKNIVFVYYMQRTWQICTRDCIPQHYSK